MQFKELSGKKVHMSQQIILGKANIHSSGPERDCIPVTARLCPAFELDQILLRIVQYVEKSHFYVGAFLEPSRRER